jgi:ubiquinone/menaquinone biosynthesis C-methylase UbiE
MTKEIELTQSATLSETESFRLITSRMNSSIAQKTQDILPYLKKYIHVDQPLIVSLGAGTGKLERAFALNLPNSGIVAIDYSLQMIEEIGKEAEQLNVLDQSGKIFPLQADSMHIPLKANSVNAVIASSMFHEIISFQDNFTIGDNTIELLRSVARIIKPGGVFALRDFMLPENPNDPVKLKIGGRLQTEDADPLKFLEQFSQHFYGFETTHIARQIKQLKMQDQFAKNATISLPVGEALEIMIHYSWAQRFDKEIREKYLHLPLTKYVSLIENCFRMEAENPVILEAQTYSQSGYWDHLDGRLDLLYPNDKPYPKPAFTGVIAFAKAF